jgi:acyl-coenzyme A thioesterase PaaI-like protein
MKDADTAAAPRAERQNGCFVCGQDNPNGLRILFESEAGGGVSAVWIPAAAQEGFRGIVHGGVISTVLDEAMSKAVAATKSEALTGELRVRFRHTVSTGETLCIRGWIVRRAKRLIETEAALTTANGEERAHAWGRFVLLPLARRTFAAS